MWKFCIGASLTLNDLAQVYWLLIYIKLFSLHKGHLKASNFRFVILQSTLRRRSSSDIKVNRDTVCVLNISNHSTYCVVPADLPHTAWKKWKSFLKIHSFPINPEKIGSTFIPNTSRWNDCVLSIRFFNERALSTAHFGEFFCE